ncbi:major facilitator superfamily domain-containing protein [Hirsutella rhossiliensis]|uniref:Major facilitator superfamily domain-containing protein n=1 Tax=Hirsutella rhossiliensis TaxID=111463 RepID=A0A9P8SMR2_9HYPO|nr:major facilitator superfamily domain-containing protein [Hirsutella rhossiliensis]KAH0967130.1 major facilitator superfamily domain-containing protein [Hirsutella rhossiliensis]
MSTPAGAPGAGHAEIGVSRVEAFNKVLYQSGKSGKILLWLLGISIGLTMFAYALDQGITSTIFTTMASSTFGQHSSLAAVSTASQIIRAISKPFIGKLADITSRPTTYVVVLVFYIVGFAVAASSSTFAAYTVGICFTSVGKSGLDLLSDIIVGDLTPLQWRGFFGAALSIPFIITVPVNGFIAEAFVDNWRWGLGMFAIIVPVMLIPAIFTLYSMQRRGEKMGMVTMAASKRLRTGVVGDSEEPTKSKGFAYWIKLLREGLIDIDILGLIILGASFSLILLPFTLAKDANGGWANAGIVVMLVIGFVLLIAFVLFEMYLAPKPLMTKRILKNRTFLAAVTIYTFNQTASAVRNTYFSSYIYIIKDWSTYNWTIFLGITTMGLSIMGPIVGLIQRRTHRYKSLMVFGAVARLIGYGLLVQSNGSMVQDTARLVAAQLIFCLGSFNVVGARVGSQASVPHEDMASIIALLSLWSTLGSSIGSAVSSAIWTNEMLNRMHMEMTGVDEATILKLYGNIKKLRTSYSFDNPARQGAIRAYAYVNGHIAITALLLASVSLLATFFMPDFYLGRQQNAVTNTGLDGERVDVPQRQSGKQGGLAHVKEESKPFYRRWLAAYHKDV